MTKPLIAAAEKEATTIIGGNFITPTLNALNYKVSQFTIRWVPAGDERGDRLTAGRHGGLAASARPAADVTAR